MHVFIVNPVAGKGTAGQFLPVIASICKKRGLAYKIETTSFHAHASDIARSWSRREKCTFYVLGGDGTLSEVASGILGSDSSLCSIPCGSGNDFLRNFLNPPATFLGMSEFLEQCVDGAETHVDAIKVNDRCALNVCSIGFDAQVVLNSLIFKKVPFVPAAMVYRASLLYTLLHMRTCNLTLNIDGQSFSGEYVLLSVANGRCYGGGILAAPQAHVDDGLLDLCFIGKVPFAQVLRTLPKYKAGKHIDDPRFTFFRAKNIEVQSPENFPLNVDGEVRMTNSVSFSIMPRKIPLRLPLNIVSRHAPPLEPAGNFFV